MTEEQYHDPAGEATQRIANALLPLVSLADVAAQLAADRHDQQTTRDQQQAARLRRQLAADHAAAAAAYAPALHRRWLEEASLPELGAAWRAAHLYADRDPRAAAAAERVEQRLRGLHPVAMRHYDTRRGQGLPPHAAMAEAAIYMAFVDPTARPGPAGPPRPALGAAVTEEVAAQHAAAASYTPGLNPRWLAQADIYQLGAVWQAAYRHAEHDTRAVASAAQVEHRLRALHPPAMRRYDDLRAAGNSPADAMRQAAPYLAGIDPTAHRGRPAPTQPAVTTTTADAAAEANAAALVLPAERDHAAAAAAGATTDNPATVRIDEHTPAAYTMRVFAAGAEHTTQVTVSILRAHTYPRPIHLDLAAAVQTALPPSPNPAPARAQTSAPTR